MVNRTMGSSSKHKSQFILVMITVTILSRAAPNDSLDDVRNRRQNFWSWGPVEDNEQSNTDKVEVQTTTPPNEDAASCLPYAPPVPNFYKPGRRISETKCYEYIWQMKFRDERDKREKQCLAYKRRKAGIHFRSLVVGGRYALSGEYPHMGALGWKAVEGTWVFKCGGALISSRFVLTAGHCTKSSRDPSVSEAVPRIVRLGDQNILDVPTKGFEPHDESIAQIIVHPSYSPPQKYNDIALLQLSRDVVFTKFIQPACLWTSYDTRSIASASVTGWGVVETAGRETSPDLKTADVDIIDSATCDGLLRRYCNRLWCGLQSTQVCAGKLAGGVDTCQGDSGGPLQVKIPVPPELGSAHYVVGVTSFGFGCARADAPGVYTRVAAFVDWIESVVWSR